MLKNVNHKRVISLQGASLLNFLNKSLYNQKTEIKYFRRFENNIDENCSKENISSLLPELSFMKSSFALLTTEIIINEQKSEIMKCVICHENCSLSQKELIKNECRKNKILFFSSLLSLLSYINNQSEAPIIYDKIALPNGCIVRRVSDIPTNTSRIFVIPNRIKTSFSKCISKSDSGKNNLTSNTFNDPIFRKAKDNKIIKLNKSEFLNEKNIIGKTENSFYKAFKKADKKNYLKKGFKISKTSNILKTYNIKFDLLKPRNLQPQFVDKNVSTELDDEQIFLPNISLMSNLSRIAKRKYQKICIDKMKKAYKIKSEKSLPNVSSKYLNIDNLCSKYFLSEDIIKEIIMHYYLLSSKSIGINNFSKAFNFFIEKDEILTSMMGPYKEKYHSTEGKNIIFDSLINFFGIYQNLITFEQFLWIDLFDMKLYLEMNQNTLIQFLDEFLFFMNKRPSSIKDVINLINVIQSIHASFINKDENKIFKEFKEISFHSYKDKKYENFMFKSYMKNNKQVLYLLIREIIRPKIL